jgi:hypothetical protein
VLAFRGRAVVKLSTAILEGVKKDGKQVFGSYFERNDKDEIVGCCALGAALIAVGKVDSTASDEFSKERRLWERAQCPACGELTGFTISVVPHLNDEHRWTREAIAAWLESVGL